MHCTLMLSADGLGHWFVHEINMADRPKRSWGTFKNAIKAKRCKPNGNENKLGKGSIVERKEMVVQRLSAEVSGKAQKYSRVGPREFVPYEEEELTIPAIKAACEKHFALAGMVCDVLAGEQGPSCQSIKHIPDPRVIHVRFIEPADGCDDPGFSGASLQMPSKSFQHPFSVPMLPSRRKEQDINNVKVKKFPKSLSLSEMLKLGKVVDTDASISVLEVYSFDLDKMAWSLIPQKVEFAIETEVLGSGGFRNAYKATSSTPGFSSATWVVKRFLPEAHKAIEKFGQSDEEHCKRVVQMHALAKNFADQLAKQVEELGISEIFGETLKFEDVYFTKLGMECVNLEKFIKGKFMKLMNNTGETCVADDNVIGQKAQCLSHFSYEKSNSQLMLLDLQGSGHTMFNPEIASVQLSHNDQLLFCVGNLTKHAIAAYIAAHSCSVFCDILGLKPLK